MLKKAILVLFVATLIGLGVISGYVLAEKKCEDKSDDDYSLAYDKGREDGKKDALAMGSYWHCVETTNSDADRHLFCFSDTDQRDDLCEMAKSESAVNAGVALNGCPSGVFISH